MAKKLLNNFKKLQCTFPFKQFISQTKINEVFVIIKDKEEYKSQIIITTNENKILAFLKIHAVNPTEPAANF